MYESGNGFWYEGGNDFWYLLGLHFNNPTNNLNKD